jgi:hypothetical protein
MIKPQAYTCENAISIAQKNNPGFSRVDSEPENARTGIVRNP